jgi:hypothetical protein
VSLIKHGDGQILPENGEQKLAAKSWTSDDGKELAEENAEADKKE